MSNKQNDVQTELQTEAQDPTQGPDTATDTLAEAAPTTEKDTPQDESTPGEAQGTPLEAQLAEAQQQAEMFKDKFTRQVAEFENYKKRTGRQMADLIATASKDILAAILPVLDDFDRMRKNDPEAFGQGAALIHHKFENILKQKGLDGMDSDGQPFDPELHEAITEIPVPDEDMKGKIVDTIERGYTLSGKIIRHAKVVVGK